MSTTKRVYEVAKDLGLDNNVVIGLFKDLGLTDVRNQYSAVAIEIVDRMKRHLEKASAQKVVESRLRADGTVVKRRAIHKPAPEPPPPASVATPSSARVIETPPVSSPISARAPISEPSAPAAAPPPEERLASSPRAAAPVIAEAPPQPVVAPPPAVEERVASSPRAAQPPPPAPEPEPAAAAPPPPAPEPARRPTAAPRTGINVWEGRPGVPMPQQPRGGPAPRRVQFDAKAGSGGGAPTARRGGPGPFMNRPPLRPGQRRHGGMAMPMMKKTSVVSTLERGAHKKIVKIEETVNLQRLAGEMGLKATEVLMKLMALGMTGVNINSTLDADTAKIVANEFGWEVEDTAVSEEQQLVEAQGTPTVVDEGKEPRPPVVTVMGHVDHGKTSLLDAIRKTSVAAGEAGGITQHIGAYTVETPHGRITFLDTPGHEAFTSMRARGAECTDVVVLVVAADDGVMPQTREAVAHARAAEVPIVVAVNKIDKPGSDPERIKRQLSELSLVSEDWGGDTLFVPVSAVTKVGVDKLLEVIALQSEVLDLKANPKAPASGVVIEAELDRGKGPVATVLVTDGTLKRGDVLLVGGTWGKVRAMLDDKGRAVAEATPSTPVSIIGLTDVPSAGDPVHVVTDADKAREIAEGRKTKEQRKSLAPGRGPVSLDELAAAMSQSDQLELRVIVKADVQGSVEAVSQALGQLSTEKVKVAVVHSAVGAISEGDVNLAVASRAIIIGFNVRPAGKATALAQKEKVEIRQYSVIYNVVDDVKAAMEGLLAPTLVEKQLGKAQVRQTFRIAKAGTIAGCMVTEGVVKRGAQVRLVRDSAVVWTGKLSGLKRFKDDAREVKEGFECGISLEEYNDVKEGDVIEVFEVEEVKQKL